MKRRTLILFLIVLACYLLLIIYGLNKVYTEPFPVYKEILVTQPENKISIAHTEIFGILERPQVIFEHQKHVEALVKEGKKDWETCSVCHPVVDNELKPTFPKKVEKKDKDSIMNAYHDECMDCHKQKIKEGKKSGPLVCGDCHSKEKKALKIKYPLKEFDFKTHYDHVEELKKRTGKKDCSLCHHIYDIEEEKEELRLVYEEGKEESCYYCHDFKNKELTDVQKLTYKKGLDIQTVSHRRCINCHIVESGKGKKAGPLKCTECHNGKYKTLAEIKEVPRPDRDQPRKIFLSFENATMKEVFFDHTSHEKNHKTCRECHHKTLCACSECHTLTGTQESKWVNSLRAMHSPFAKESCVGCHNSIATKNKDCVGCHMFIKPVSIETMIPKSDFCNKCHTGKAKPQVKQIAKPRKVKDKLKIDTIAKEFEPADFPHLKIINKLIDISNNSKLATYFHRDLTTLCAGCHHNTQKLEITETKAPLCRSCHYIGTADLEKTRLLSAYHRKCLGCHEKMELEKGRKCSECHKESAKKPKEIITEKNSDVVRQNKEKILNIWHPK